MTVPASGLLSLTAGHYTTVQDRGRPGWRGLGVPEGGAFDRSSFRLANALVGNGPDSDAAALELTLVGETFLALGPLGLALAGAEVIAELDRNFGRSVEPLQTPCSFTLEAGERLFLTRGMRRGARAYLAVHGGWQTPIMLGSRSSEERRVGGTHVAAHPSRSQRIRPADSSFPDPLAGPIRLIDGPDAEVPPDLLGRAYLVGGASDRRGLRLEGQPPLLGFDRPGRASAPVAPGALQIAGDRPIILGVAGGTMGGYPHVAHVISADLDRIGQARPGDWLRFARVDLAEARRLDLGRIAGLAARDRRISLFAGSNCVV